MIYLENNTSSARSYILFVRAKDNATHGTTTVIKDGLILGVDLAFGGTHVQVPGGAGYVYETAYAPGTIERTALFALSSTGNLLAYDFNSGVGQTSRIAVSGATSLLASYYPWGGSPGNVQLYASDTNSDFDGDGLGRLLEQALGICDRNSDPGCASVHNLTDSDHDGLDDGAELFGIDVPGPSELFLARWGASPASKDAFVEVDYAASDFPIGSPMVLGGTAALENWTTAVQVLFEGGTSNDIGNLDSSVGVRLHLDVGIDPVDPQYTGLYGAFGGGGTASTTTNRETAYNLHMSSVRQGVFRYALAIAAGGQASGPRFIWGYGSDGNPMTFAHELGHTMGLNHHGADEFDGTTANCKPNYLSLMNYAYGGLNSFSDETPTFTLNSSAITERFVFPTSLYANQLLNPGSWVGATLDVGRSFDWNNDGDFEVADVRWPINFTWGSCQALFNEAMQKEMDAGPHGTYVGAPELVMRGSQHIVLFQARTDGTIMYQVASNGSLADGSCPQGDGYDSDCYSWSTNRTVPGVTNAVSVSAVWWKNSLVIAFQTTSGDYIVKRSNRLVFGSILSQWSTNLVLGSTDVAPELAILNVDSNYHGSSSMLAIFTNAVGAGSVRFRSTTDTNITTSTAWSSESGVTTTQFTNLQGNLAPSIVTWPQVNPPAQFANVATACGVFPDLNGRLNFYCLDRSSPTLRWRLMGAAHDDFGRPSTSMAPSLMFRRDRLANGSSLDSHNLSGTFWLSFAVANSGYTDTYISSSVSLQDPPIGDVWSFVLRGKTSTQWSSAAPNTGLVFLDDPSLGAPKGAWVWRVDRPGQPQEDILYFFKIADGTVDAEYSTGNDFQVMEARICRNLQGAAYCGLQNDSLWGY